MVRSVELLLSPIRIPRLSIGVRRGSIWWIIVRVVRLIAINRWYALVRGVHIWG